MREWLPEPGRARLTASPSRTTKKKLRARETVSHWTRGASWIFRDRGESGIHNSPMTARNSVTRHRVFLLGAERKEKQMRSRLVSKPSRCQRPRGAPHLARGVLGFWSASRSTPAIPSAPDNMSAPLCMSMASLAVSGAGRGVTAARMGRAAASKGAVAGSSAFFPAKASAKMTMKSSLAGACPPIPPTNAKPRARGDATARATTTREASPSRRHAAAPRARHRASTARRTPTRRPRVSGKSVGCTVAFFRRGSRGESRILSFAARREAKTFSY